MAMLVESKEESDALLADSVGIDDAAASGGATTATNYHIPWVEKYRPNSLDELIAHEEIITILNKLIENNKLPHLLFHGPPGTGKTSTIVACAKKMYGERYGAMTLTLNASDDRGIDVVRNQIKEFAGTKKLFSSGVKLIVLDEADAMTNEAQAALRRVIEKYTANTRFCLICNYVNKIIPALQSRCTRFRFAPLRAEQISGRLDTVIERESVRASPSGCAAILQLADGDLRRVLNLLQSTHMAYEEVTEENVYLTAGAALPSTIEAVLTSLLTASFQEAHASLSSIVKDFGYALCDIVTALSTLVLRLDIPDAASAHLIDKLSTIEYHLSHGISEKLQLGALVGAFIVVRRMMTPERTAKQESIAQGAAPATSAGSGPMDAL